jgi:NADH-quinone oxidoreductase subunit A
MAASLLPILMLILCATILAVGMFVVGQLLGPKRSTDVKRMPYESGMDPIHDARRRFDFRFHAVAIAFLVFDVELLFLYPWAVANKDPQGLRRVASVAEGIPWSPGLVFAEVLIFVGLLAVGYVYAWRRGVFRWR